MRKNFLVQEAQQQRKKSQKSERELRNVKGFEEYGLKYRQKSFDGLIKKNEKPYLTEREKNKSVARRQDTRSRKNVYSPCFNQSYDSKQNLMNNKCGNLHEQSTHYQINIQKALINLQIKQRLPKQRVLNYKIRQKEQIFCKNHPQKVAMFQLYIESEVMRYCGVCSVKLASQGFIVKSIENKEQNDKYKNPYDQADVGKNERSKAQEGRKKMMMIEEFLNETYELQSKYEASMKRLQDVRKMHDVEIRNADRFFQNLINLVKAMEAEHINSLKNEKEKDSQIGMIQFDYLQQNVEELSRIWEQIDQNFHDIMTNLDHQEFNDGLKYYISKVHVYKHKIEQVQQFFQGIPQSHRLEGKETRIKQFLINLLNKKTERNQFQISVATDSEQSVSRFTTKTNQTQLLIKPSQFLNQFKLSPRRLVAQKKPTPFRVLFEEQDSSKEQYKEINQEK